MNSGRDLGASSRSPPRYVTDSAEFPDQVWGGVAWCYIWWPRYRSSGFKHVSVWRCEKTMFSGMILIFVMFISSVSKFQNIHIEDDAGYWRWCHSIVFGHHFLPLKKTCDATRRACQVCSVWKVSGSKGWEEALWENRVWFLDLFINVDSNIDYPLVN